MTEIKRASEMTMEQIEEVLGRVDWAEVHRLRVFSDSGSGVSIHTDASLSTLDSGTTYRDPEAAGVIASLNCWGRDVDTQWYAEGLAEKDEENGGYAYEGRNISEDEMIEIAIREGDHASFDHSDEVVDLVTREREEDKYFSQM
ncbi:MAG: hypothetical protein M3P49_05025 [Actinomycetota bacterium]|nr:hypothetical protein [Actinomycetota bacterium]